MVRTSPVHGTAYDIAGKNIANEQSVREAVYLSCEIIKKREEYFLLKRNALNIKN
ncbi:MAG: 4-hydroxythreonine-4-phosphate dehydrogenase PdxA [Flavobacteriales bacterium]